MMKMKQLTPTEFENFTNSFNVHSLYQTVEYANVIARQGFGTLFVGMVDNDKVIMRRVMTKEEAEELTKRVTEIDTVWIQEEKKREQMYKEAIRTYDCRSLVQVIKTLYIRKQNRIQEGKKVLSSDEQYLRKAEELLYSEMSVALSIPREEVETYIKDVVSRQESVV